MRRLSDSFMRELQTGFLSPLLAQVVADKDLDLHIRSGYVSIYYKGNSLLKLLETANGYVAEIHQKFKQDLPIPRVFSSETTANFLSLLPYLKHNIIQHGKFSLEVEYEQLIIRANNLEARSNAEYLILDRQYALGRDRFDMIGLCWSRKGRSHSRTAVPCFFEVKFALNTDIKDIHTQLHRYYQTASTHASMFAQECQSMLEQKIELGLFKKTQQQLEAMRAIKVIPDHEQFQFIIVLVDYNPHSKHLDLARLQALTFADQIRVFRSGFAMWQNNLVSVTALDEVDK